MFALLDGISFGIHRLMSDEKVSPVDQAGPEDNQSSSSTSAFSPWHSKSNAKDSSLKNSKETQDEEEIESQGNKKRAGVHPELPVCKTFRIAIR